MPLSDDEILAILLGELAADEKAHSAVYIAETPISPGARLEFPRITIQVPWEAALAFVDQDPLANWSHACRYILIDRETGRLQSFDAQLPPFRQDQVGRWRVAYKAPSVPEAALAVPQ